MDDQASAIEEEYILLDLEEVFHGGAIPTNCPYTLSGLDTLNPILTLGNGLKLVRLSFFSRRTYLKLSDRRVRGHCRVLHCFL
ncbi:hypothetical protein SELMODRAFT_448503 [Selaginella moellendorffii]|uniref:Uncharacterized protein n=1 Tax=Selaginella moellendorffii TaxID=88036 RepID=D8T7H6_SELML|nr:hypothetical protein SELMODRAFT_448503 [Selaginella moellendorffii]